MPRDMSSCCDRSRDFEKEKKWRSIWVVDNPGMFNNEPNFLSAATFNQLIDEMNTNKRNIEYLHIGYERIHRYASNASIPGHVSSGTKYSAAEWNNVCHQVAVLISDAKRVVADSYSEDKVRGVELNPPAINVSESEAYALRYSAGEVVTASKSISKLINIVRRARIRCTCQAETYEPCYSHCPQHKCRERDCCQKSND